MSPQWRWGTLTRLHENECTPEQLPNPYGNYGMIIGSKLLNNFLIDLSALFTKCMLHFNPHVIIFWFILYD